MKDFFDVVSTSETLVLVLAIATTSIVLTAIAIYLVAFSQGRSVSFWPPKIGERPVESLVPSQNTSGSDSPVHGDEIVTTQKPPVVGVPLVGEPLAILHAESGQLQGHVWVLGSGRRSVSVGRSSECDISIPSDSYLGLHHFGIRIKPTDSNAARGRAYTFEIIDTGSPNGTFVSGLQISQPTSLASGALVQAGASQFSFYLLEKHAQSLVAPCTQDE